MSSDSTRHKYDLVTDRAFSLYQSTSRIRHYHHESEKIHCRGRNRTKSSQRPCDGDVIFRDAARMTGPQFAPIPVYNSDHYLISRAIIPNGIPSLPPSTAHRFLFSPTSHIVYNPTPLTPSCSINSISTCTLPLPPKRFPKICIVLYHPPQCTYSELSRNACYRDAAETRYSLDY